MTTGLQTRAKCRTYIVYSRDLDIICFIEIWLNDSVYNHEILPFGYNIYY
jgi:hypothetical protein